MVKLIYNISLLFFLFVGNILIKNYKFYFLLIYIGLFFYHFYICFQIFKNDRIHIFFKEYFFISILLYIISYFVICDSNPFFFIIVYYTFFPCFIKAVLIIIIHTYVSATYINNLINCKLAYIPSFKYNRKTFLFFKSYFLSFIFTYIHKNEKNIFYQKRINDADNFRYNFIFE